MKQAVVIASLAVVLSAGPTAASFEKCQATVKAMRELVVELRGFEHSPTFARYGFAAGGPHFKWLEKAEAFRDKTDRADMKSDLDFTDTEDVVWPGELIIWGLDKMRCATRGGVCDREFIKPSTTGCAAWIASAASRIMNLVCHDC